MITFSSSLAERIKLQRRILPKGFNGGISSRETGVSKQKLYEVTVVDDHWTTNRKIGFSRHEIIVADFQELHEVAVNRASETTTQNGFNGGISNREKGVSEQELYEVTVVNDHWTEDKEIGYFGHEITVADDQELHEADVNNTSETTTQNDGNGIKEIDHSEFKESAVKTRSIQDVYSFSCRTHIYAVPSSDDSYSNEKLVTLEEEEEEEPDDILEKSCKYNYESESHDADHLDYSPPKKKEKVCFGTVERKNKNHIVQKTSMKRKNKKLMDESNDFHVHEKGNVKDKVKGDCMKLDHESVVKYQKFRKGRRKDDANSVDAILDSIIKKESVHGKEGGDSIPLQFKFDDSEDECSSQKTNESYVEDLFQEMDFELASEEIGSYRTPTVSFILCNVENEDQEDAETNPLKLCQRGEHGDAYLEEQTGMRCRLCGAVVLESRYVIPKLAINLKIEANTAHDKCKRSNLFYEQQLSCSENLYSKDSNFNHPLGIFNKTEGTVWELISTDIQAHLYPHQQEGFKFLWENLAGTIQLSRLNRLDPCTDGHGGGGCIISHAPGTGKTLLTIVFIESFVKKFPKCCPVIIAPASMLLTWEAEFKKWQVGLSFINLNNSDYLRKKMMNDISRPSKHLLRAMKISSWSNGGCVLGVSYYLYEKLAGNREKKNLEKMGNILRDVPGLVVLDEGHTPRNQNSKIWNTLLNLKTKNRVILSGTPFQNNFRELFNTLRLVRPETASSILNEKEFAHMIYENNKKEPKDIKKLKAIISPFVHVHEGHILENKLPGLIQSVVLLSPLPFQKALIEKLGNFTRTFEYEHKVALMSVHPSLILHCSLSDIEKESVNKQELKSWRLQPDVGVKTRFVMELIRLSVPHEKVLIFSQYIQPLKLLKDQIAFAFGWDVEKEVMIIKGMIHQNLRQTIINDFNNPNSKMKVLLASTRCCSEGIHLTGASRVVLLDVVWNPSVERQAISRAYRLGQKKVVYTYHLMTAGTTEEEKYDKQVEKGRLAEMVFSSTAMAGGQPKNKKNVDASELNDKILEQMVDHQKLKDMFKEIRYPESQTRV
ncbi:hypothetical protein SSX86_028109 [Deinandra increscens subsp. villosa]|uniref:Uncharacterized protein n=1 Tax=Deinandra increscens subsp. villosa TaxID=3103831 RepID=A0AAP0CCF8_9ASTR